MMSLDTSKSFSKLSQLDPRIKLLYLIGLLFSVFILSDLIDLLILLFFAIYIYIKLNSVFKAIEFIWSLKWFYIITSISLVLFIQNLEVLELVRLLLSITIILISFQVFSQTTSPDQLFDSLIKLKIPLGLTWRVSLTLRQSIFFIDEFKQVFSIQKMRLQIIEKNIIKYWVKISAVLVTALFSISIIRAEELTRALIVRGYRKPNKILMLNSNSLNKFDFGFILIFAIVFASLYLHSSQVFI